MSAEHVTDEELTEVARLFAGETESYRVQAIWARIQAKDTTLLPRLAAELRALRARETASLKALDGVEPENESIPERIERLSGAYHALLSEQEERAAALRAPVDVEGDARFIAAKRAQRRAHDIVNATDDVKQAAAEMRRITGCGVLDSVRAVAPHVEHLAAARADLAKVVLERDAMAERLREGRAEIERLEATLEDLRQKGAGASSMITRAVDAFLNDDGADTADLVDAIERVVGAQLGQLRADLARETARRDEQIAQLEQRLGERETEATQYRMAASRAAEVLRTVEWSGVADGGDPAPGPGGCPCCGADKPGPHAATCALAACLPRGSAERTPETVLRAMLRAYDASDLDISVAYYAEFSGRAGRAAERLARWRRDVRDVLARLLSGREPRPDFGYVETEKDYEMRLSGARPLDAPPLEAS